MRSLEILLLVANVVAFIALVVPLPDRMRWMRHLALIPLPAMAAQLLVEGGRWQMVPAYALALLFALVWLLQTVKPARWRIERTWMRRLGAGLGVGLGVVVLAVSDRVAYNSSRVWLSGANRSLCDWQGDLPLGGR
jgi:hypothetical protein